MKIHMAYSGLRRVISGAQTGADQAGLWAARQVGLETGGHIPKGWRTQAGPMPSLGTDFGIIEHSSPDYPPRTKLNVKNADATVRLASNFLSPGEKLTLKYCIELKKPNISINLSRDKLGHEVNAEDAAHELVNFLILNHVAVLNVAGNSDKTDLNGFHFREAARVLSRTFQILRELDLIIPTDFC